MSNGSWSGLHLPAALLLIATGCRDARAPDRSASSALAPADLAAPPGAPAPVSSDLRSRALPELAGPFHGSPLVEGAGFVRRTYSRGPVQISVTLAAAAPDDEHYAQWVKLSADYPAATLDLPAGAGAGFYDCIAGRPRSCSLHAQLRSGVHVEGMGGGTATRGDLDDLLRLIPLRSLATAR